METIKTTLISIYYDFFLFKFLILNLKFNKYTYHYNSIQVQVAILFQEYERSTRDYILLASSRRVYSRYVFVGRFETKLETLTSEARSL